MAGKKWMGAHEPCLLLLAFDARLVERTQRIIQLLIVTEWRIRKRIFIVRL
jgi:hypothetical protein